MIWNIIKVYLFESIPVFDTKYSFAIDKTFKQEEWLEHLQKIITVSPGSDINLGAMD